MLNFNEHITQKINKCSRIIELMKRLSLILPRKQLLKICKTSVRYHLDRADIMMNLYDKPFNSSFKEELEKGQYSAASIITEAIKRTSWKYFL